MKKNNAVAYPAWKLEFDELLNNACSLCRVNCSPLIADIVINTIRCACYCVGRELQRPNDLPK